MTEMTGERHRWSRRRPTLALAAVLVLVAAAAAAQTSSDTVQRVLRDLPPLPPPTEPYERSRADQLWRERLRDERLQDQRQAVRAQQQLIDQSGRRLQQDLRNRQQRDLLLQQQTLKQGLQPFGRPAPGQLNLP
jgi:hypothetical protein